MRLLYTALLYLITPLVLLRLLWRSRELRDYRYRWNERFGFVPRPAQEIAVWVHAVSVGESLAALPLIRELLRRHGAGRVLVTTTTPTGSARIREALGAEVLHTYAPYDLPDVVARFLARMRPGKVIVMETELWPNLFRALAARRIPLLIANARLSPNSYAGYSKVPGFARATLSDCSMVAAQSEADGERFRSLGAPRVSVMGNIKFDVEVPEEMLARGRALRTSFGDARPVWVAASTHEGEEEMVLEAHRRLLATLPQALLILVPRHPQRFDAAAKLIERSGLGLQRRSTLPGKVAQSAVLLGDSMGEMFAYYAASDAAFVGGSFVAIGGHNVLEPAAIGLPVLFGPHMHNFLPSRELLLAGGGAIECADAAALAQSLAQLLGDADERRRRGAAAQAAIAGNRGALARLLDLLDMT